MDRLEQIRLGVLAILAVARRFIELGATKEGRQTLAEINVEIATRMFDSEMGNRVRRVFASEEEGGKQHAQAVEGLGKRLSEYVPEHITYAVTGIVVGLAGLLPQLKDVQRWLTHVPLSEAERTELEAKRASLQAEAEEARLNGNVMIESSFREELVEIEERLAE